MNISTCVCSYLNSDMYLPTAFCVDDVFLWSREGNKAALLFIIQTFTCIACAQRRCSPECPLKWRRDMEMCYRYVIYIRCLNYSLASSSFLLLQVGRTKLANISICVQKWLHRPTYNNSLGPYPIITRMPISAKDIIGDISGPEGKCIPLS